MYDVDVNDEEGDKRPDDEVGGEGEEEGARRGDNASLNVAIDCTERNLRATIHAGKSPCNTAEPKK